MEKIRPAFHAAVAAVPHLQSRCDHIIVINKRNGFRNRPSLYTYNTIRAYTYTYSLSNASRVIYFQTVRLQRCAAVALMHVSAAAPLHVSARHLQRVLQGLRNQIRSVHMTCLQYEETYSCVVSTHHEDKLAPLTGVMQMSRTHASTTPVRCCSMRALRPRPGDEGPTGDKRARGFSTTASAAESWTITENKRAAAIKNACNTCVCVCGFFFFY